MMYRKPRHLNRKRNFLLINLIVLCAWLSLPINSSAEIATLDEFKAFGEKFDHLTTGFALTGEHAKLDCGECHIGGVFEALPRECDACHDNVIAAGKPSNHVQTNQPCDVCHTTGAFLTTAIMDHSITSGNCMSCHDGVTATGKPPTHIATTDVCEACHTVNYWSPAISVDHEQVLGSCFDCHNNVVTAGKTPSHIPTSDVCEACHLATGDASWPRFTVDHNHVQGACSFCHQLPNGHIPVQQECNACHQVAPAPWTDVTAFNHATVQGQSCTQSGCHDGVSSTGKPVDALHANVTDDCGACHSAGGAFRPALRVDHTQVIGACMTCHDGTIATGKDADHIDTTEDCSACHVPGGLWSTAAFDHSTVAGQACNSAGCHTKPTNHISTTDVCEACHRPWPDLWTNVAGVDHDQVLGDCVNCHNNTIAIGKPTNHPSTSNLCGACHSTAAFIPVNQVDHSQVTGSCSNCHNGTDATGKPGTHINSSNVCDACHSTNAWRPVSQVDHNQIIGVDQCGSCHNKPGGHPVTSDNCGACHRDFTNWNRVNMTHNEVPAGSCSSCHNGVIAEGKNRGHCPTTQECDVCHTSTNDWERTSRGC
jgi:hypothetical protein